MDNKKANFMVQSDSTGNDHILQEMDIKFGKYGKHTWSETKLIWQAKLVPSVITWQAYLVPIITHMASISSPFRHQYCKHAWSPS